MASVTDRLVWFELQICPHVFRLAVLPGQPVLFGYRPEGGEKSRTTLIPYAGNEALVETLAAGLASLVRANRILGTPPNAPGRAFRKDTMGTASLHIRIAYANGRRWASMYALNDVPSNVRTLLEGSKQLGLDLLGAAQSRAISGERAMALVEAEAQAGTVGEGAAIVAQVKVTPSGQIHLNGAPVNAGELSEALHRLRDVGGEVWYYRERPDQEPSPEANETIQSILDLVTELGLPIKLSQTDFE
jgi:hypothetical protein